jgi:hypothetical protein
MAQPRDNYDPSTEALLSTLPQLQGLLPLGRPYKWASEQNRILVKAELEAARGSEVFGYVHHVEMHLARALEIVLDDLRQNEQGGD